MRLDCVIIFIIACFSAHCAGGALPQSSIPAPSLTVGGTVESPQSSTFNLVALVKELDSASASEVTCSLYSLEGELLADVTTADDGSYTATIVIEDLKGDDDIGTSWSEEIILACENGIQLFTEVSVNEEATLILDLGSANTSTSLLAIQWASQIDGFTIWGENYAANRPTATIDCFMKAGESLYSSASIDDGYLFDDVAQIKLLFDGLIASGVTPDQIGFDSWPQLMMAMLDGNLQTDILQDMINVAKLADATIDDADFLSGHSQAALAVSEIAALMTDNFNISSAALDVSICSALADETLNAAAFIQPFLASDDVATLNETFSGGDGFDLHLNILSACQTDGSCDAVAANAPAYTGFIAGYQGNYTNIKTVDQFVRTSIDGILLATLACNGSSVNELKACGISMKGTIDAYGGLDGFADNGNLDPQKFEVWSEYWKVQIQGGLDPSGSGQDYFDEIKNQVGATIGNKDNPVNACLASAPNLGEKQVCLNGLPFCGDNICDDFENSAGICIDDCGGAAPADDPVDNDPAAAINFSGFYAKAPNQIGPCFNNNVFQFAAGDDAASWTFLGNVASNGLQLSMLFTDEGGGSCMAILSGQSCSCMYQTVDSQLRISFDCNHDSSGGGLDCSLELRKNL